MANATFQTDRVATVPDGTVVAAHDRDGVLYQRFVEGFDYILHYYDGSGNLIYRCEHSTHGTATSETDWIITKYTHGANGITKIEKLPGSVDGRVALGWD
jgi:hypothetical protein